MKLRITLVYELFRIEDNIILLNTAYLAKEDKVI